MGDLIFSKDLLVIYNWIDEKYIKFIEGLFMYYELEDFILVYVGLDFILENFFSDVDSMMYIWCFIVD